MNQTSEKIGCCYIFISIEPNNLADGDYVMLTFTHECILLGLHSWIRLHAGSEPIYSITNKFYNLFISVEGYKITRQHLPLELFPSTQLA